jgi:filamentous hemagglutinin
MTDEEQQYALHKLATGTMPEGQDISKVIVDGYVNGVLIAGAWYLGPAAGISKVAAGSTIASIANGTYQWYDLNQPGNENKTWDYKSSISAAVTGGLAPGRGIIMNTEIAMSGSVFSDGPDMGAASIAGSGALIGGIFGKYAPIGVEKIIGENKAPGFVFDAVGSLGTEFLGGYIKNASNPPTATDMQTDKQENKK